MGFRFISCGFENSPRFLRKQYSQLGCTVVSFILSVITSRSIIRGSAASNLLCIMHREITPCHQKRSGPIDLGCVPEGLGPNQMQGAPPNTLHERFGTIWCRPPYYRSSKGSVLDFGVSQLNAESCCEFGGKNSCWSRILARNQDPPNLELNMLML